LSECWITDVDYGVEQTVTVKANSKIGLTSGSSPSSKGTAFAVISADLGDNAACGVLSNNQAACWGPNASIYGRGAYGSPHRNTSGIDWIYTADYTPLQNVSKLSVSSHHGCASTTTGRVYCWGDNVTGEIGIPALRDGSLVNAPYAVEVSPAITDATDIVVGTDYYGGGFSCAVRTGGKVSCWGSNRFGTLGSGSDSVTKVLAPTEIPGLTGVSQLTTDGMTVCSRLTAGSVKCWGLEVGTNLYQKRYNFSPSVTPFTSGVDSVVAGNQHVCVSRSGVIDCIGRQVMNLNTTYFMQSQRRILGPASVQSFAQAAADTDCVVTQTNSFWCWGANTNRILRDGTFMPNEDPTQISTALPVSKAAISDGQVCVIPTRGGYECWGGWTDSLS
jgi:alpha-tubulin suppressor-like RCC1 family protein